MEAYGYLGNFDFYGILEKAYTEKEAVEINNTLVASTKHRVFVLNENGVREVFAEEIKEGDYLLVPRKIEIEPKELRIPDFEYEEVFTIENPEEVKEELRKHFSLKNSKKCKELLGIGARHLRRILNQGYPTTKEVIRRMRKLVRCLKVKQVQTLKHQRLKKVRKLTENLAQFFGYFYGDGSRDFYNNTIRIKEERLEVAKAYSKLFKEIFGLRMKVEKLNSKNCYQLRKANSYVAKVLKYLLENMERIFECDEKIIKAFLRGLFDAEGSVGNVVSISQANKKFLIFVKLLLLRLGIHSTINKLGDKYYRLRVNKHDSVKIGFTASDKQAKLKSTRRRERKIPIKRELIKEVVKLVGGKVRFTHPEAYISYKELKELCEEYEEIRKIFGSLLDFYFEKVFSKKRIKKPMRLVDIETACKNFIANGYLVHNSTYRVYLRRGKAGTRIARMVDAPNLPEAEAIFKITEEGIKDP
ncbi:MAG: hypothetical protein DRP00_00355 [Candidatus Aenigmatarchaeota archaeon]|nr:MAG: hypothetical protein DRP00_00355 [Candidatus Aenigmarchaeota archaeon]